MSLGGWWKGKGKEREREGERGGGGKGGSRLRCKLYVVSSLVLHPLPRVHHEHRAVPQEFEYVDGLCRGEKRRVNKPSSSKSATRDAFGTGP